MKKMAWGFGLAAAGMVFMTGQALAEGGASAGSTGSSGSSSGSSGSAQGSTAGSPMSPSDTGTGSTWSKDSSSTSGHFNALQGKVENFDRSKNELTLAGSDKKLKVDSSTQVMKDGARASLEDIKEGDQVRASFSGSGSNVMVRSLDIMSASSLGTGSGSSSSSPGSMGTGSSGASGTSGDSTRDSAGTSSGGTSSGSSTTK